MYIGELDVKSVHQILTVPHKWGRSKLNNLDVCISCIFGYLYGIKILFQTYLCSDDRIIRCCNTCAEMGSWMHCLLTPRSGPCCWETKQCHSHCVHGQCPRATGERPVTIPLKQLIITVKKKQETNFRVVFSHPVFNVHFKWVLRTSTHSNQITSERIARTHKL